MRGVGSWAHMMSTTVSIAPRVSQDVHGKPTYGSAVIYLAHIGRNQKISRTTDGQDVLSGVSIHLNTSDFIESTAQVTLTTGDAGSTQDGALHPLIASVDRLSDGNGAHHTVLYMAARGRP